MALGVLKEDPSEKKVYKAPTSFSQEQQEIIHCPAQIVVGQAFAGTGKSTTGIGFVMNNPDKKILVLCFNTANALEAREKYEALGLNNAKVMTAHALAFQSLSEHQRVRVAHRWNSVTLRSELPMVGGRGDMRTAAITHAILSDFFISADQKINPVSHGKTARNNLKASDTAINQCAVYAQQLWEAMNATTTKPSFLRTAQNAISIPHDAYLKMFVIKGEKLPFDAIIFDEAQDANPVMLELLRTQYERKNPSKILLLGDQHQAIYEFRGAVNAMQKMPDTAKILPLTQSWRFGPRVAAFANLLLQELKGETLSVQGMGKDRPFDKSATRTYISRTNADLLERAISINGEGVYWVGGIEGRRVNVLNDIWALRRNRLDEIKDMYVKRNYGNWDTFVQAAEHDHESKILMDLVERYNSDIPRLTHELAKNQAERHEDAQMILSTAHSSKGLEFPQVSISNDFANLFKTAESYLACENETFPEQEINLMYVALTRAQGSVKPNRNMMDWIDDIESHRQNRLRAYDPQSAPSPSEQRPKQANEPANESSDSRHSLSGQATKSLFAKPAPIFGRARP